MFTKREMAALAWAEVLTGIGPQGVGDEAYAAAKTEFGESELVFLTTAIASINAWNRIAMAYRFTPPVSQEGD